MDNWPPKPIGEEIFKLIEDNKFDEAVLLYEQKYPNKGFISFDKIIDEKLAKFIPFCYKDELMGINQFATENALKIAKAVVPNIIILCINDTTVEAARNWSREHKEIIYYLTYKNTKITLELIDKVYQEPYMQFWDNRTYTLNYTSDLAIKLKEIKKRGTRVIGIKYPTFYLSIKKEEDYNSILRYTENELKKEEAKTKSEKKSVYESIYQINGFCIDPLTMELLNGNFDDYYRKNIQFNELSNTAMIYLLKKKKMTKYWASNLTLEKMQFLLENGFGEFTKKAWNLLR